MKRVKYEIPQIRVFQVVETVSILAGSPTHDTTFIPSVTGRIDGGTEDLDGDTYDASVATQVLHNHKKELITNVIKRKRTKSKMNSRFLFSRVMLGLTAATFCFLCRM